MMRKIQITVLAMFAVFAFGAFTASSALAESKILFKEEEIVAALKIEIVGALLLEDMKATGPPVVLCNGIFDGTIEPKGTLVYIEELLTEGGVLLAGEGTNDLIECEDDKSICTNPVDVEVNLPKWHVEVILTLEASLEIFLAHFLKTSEITELKEVGVVQPEYIVDCNSILGLVLDTCSGLSSARLFNSAEGLLGSFNSLPDSEKDGAESEETDCTVGGAKQGLIVSVTLAGAEDTEASAGLVRDANEAGSFSVSP